MGTTAAFLKRNPFLATAVLLCFLAGLCLLFGTGCAPNIYVTPDHKTIDHGAGNTVQFQAKDVNGNLLAGVTWSCDSGAGTVTATGLFTATGWGTCNVTAAKSGYTSGSARVQVPTYLSGTLSTSQTLTKQNNPYILSGTVIVPAGKTLTINPGTVVKAKPGATLQVVGTLTSVGTSSEPVPFTSFKDDSLWGDTNDDGNATSPAPADWGGLCLKNATQPSRLSYTRIIYGGYYYPRMPPDPAVYRPGLSIEAGSHQVSHCQLSNCGSPGGTLVISGGSPQIKDDTGVAGPVAINGGSPTVSNCNISVGTLSVSGGDAHHHGLQCTRCPGKWY